MLQSVKDSVHSLFTIGFTPASARPEANAATAATANIFNFSARGLPLRSSMPAQAPKSVVTVLLMKLIVT